MAGASTTSPNSRTCSICLEIFTKPKLLPCFHTFCEHCLDQYTSRKAVNGMFNCPVCRRSVTLPSSGVTGFQTNFYVVAEHVKTEASHEFCCKHEGEPLKFYCEVCEKPICRDCKLTSHEGHATVDLEDVVEATRIELAEAKVGFDGLVCAFERQVKQTSENKKTRCAAFDAVIADVKTEADNVIAKVNAARKCSIRNMKRMKAKDSARFDESISELIRKKGLVEDQSRRISALLVESGGTGVLLAASGLKQRLRQMKRTAPRDVEVNTQQLVRIKSSCNIDAGFTFQGIKRPLVPVEAKKGIADISRSYKVDADGGTIDIICPSDNEYTSWVGVRRQGDTSAVAKINYLGTVLTSYDVPTQIYDECRQEGILNILRHQEVECPDDELDQIEKELSLKQRPLSDTRNGLTCTTNVSLKTVTVENERGEQELELSAFNLPSEARVFSPADVCWLYDCVSIVDRGDNSLLVNIPNSRSIMSKYIRMDRDFLPTTVAVGKNRWIWVGEENGYVSVVRCSE